MRRMFKGLAPALFVAVGALACAPSHARADFSACAAAFDAKDDQRKIELYSLCLKHGGLMSSDVAGALNNRGIAYEQTGDIDKALQDFILATKYDPNWPDFRFNRARAEARKGQCAEAVADTNMALKMAPHRKQILDFKDWLATGCPVLAKPSN